MSLVFPRVDIVTLKLTVQIVASAIAADNSYLPCNAKIHILYVVTARRAIMPCEKGETVGYSTVTSKFAW